MAIEQGNSEMIKMMAQMQQDMEHMRLQMAQNQAQVRTIGESNLPHNFYQNKSPYHLKINPNEDYKIPGESFNLVKENQYHGFPDESPLDHLYEFEYICDLTKPSNYPTSEFKSRLFHFSVADKAKSWFKELPPASLTSWETIKAEFIDHFYTQEKTKGYREKISSFAQLPKETFSEAWSRFDSYAKDCPHHGYSAEALLMYFYDGVRRFFQQIMNTASNGNFSTQSIKGARTLIQNLAAKYDTFEEPKEVFNVESAEIEKLRAQIDKLMLVTHNDNVVPPPEDTLALIPKYREESYVYRESSNLFPELNCQPQSFHPCPTEPQSNDLKAMTCELLSAQQNSCREIAENLSFPPPEGIFALNLRSGKTVEGPKMPPHLMRNEEKEVTPEDLEVVVEKEKTSEEREEEIPGEPELDRTPFNSVGPNEPIPPKPVERVFFPKAPYPIPPRKSQKDLEIAKCKEMLKDLSVKLPLVDAIQMIPALKRYLKTLVTSKLTDQEDHVMMTKECSAIFQNNLVRKLSDPGRFVLSVQINSTEFSRSLCDLGSSVNLMPFSVAKKLGLTNFKPAKLSLVFADRSVKSPVGILEDLPVKVGGTVVPTDFVVLELEDEPIDPLILGRPFLCTAGAMIDVQKGRIDLRLGNIVMKFEMDKMLKQPTFDGKTFSVMEVTEGTNDIVDDLSIDDPLTASLLAEEMELMYLSKNEEEVAAVDVEPDRILPNSVEQIGHEPFEILPIPEKSMSDHGKVDDDPWSKSKAPKVELKELPSALKYIFLG